MSDRTLLALFALASVVVMAYSLLITQQILLGLLFVFGGALVYLTVRFLRAFEQIANALQRISERDG